MKAGAVQDVATTSIRVIELRNSRLAEGTTGAFMRYFEDHFLFSQRDEGMHVLGQFAVVGDPTRFVWIRGFADMQARLRGLSRFYAGPVWQARRAEANAMIREHHDVHLLRPLGSIGAVTGSRSLESRAPEPAGVVRPDTGLVVVDFHRGDPEALDDVADVFDRNVRPALVRYGHRVLGHFVTERMTNDYPRLPVIQDPALFVVLSAYRDHEHHASLRADPASRAAADELRARSTGDPTTLVLRPTARSIIRHEDA
jgi:quinol monooxygenase YgiN